MMIIANFGSVFLSKFSKGTVIGKTEIVSRMSVHGTASSIVGDTDAWTNGVLDEWHV